MAKLISSAKPVMQLGWMTLLRISAYHQPIITTETVWRFLGIRSSSNSFYCGANISNAVKPLSTSLRLHNPVFPCTCEANVSPLCQRTCCKLLTNFNSSIHQDSTKSSGPDHFIEPTRLPLPVKIVGASPALLQPYLKLMRVDRPIGNWLVFLPCAWSITLATPAGQLPDPKMLGLFALGSFFMRGAGCTINDMWDKDFDSKVERTKERPLASGQLTRFKALCFLSIPLSISLAILLTFNMNTIILGVCSMVPCVIYPLMKRITYWPQAFLGLTFNWGAIMGWTAVSGSLDWAVVSLYVSSIAWTLVYDTIYAYQDIEDDLKIGVKSTAIKFGDQTKYWLAGFTSVITTGLMTTGYLCDQTWPYYAGVGLFAAHLGHQIVTVDLSNGEDCGKKFRSNRNLGLIFWAAIIAANLMKDSEKTNEPEMRTEAETSLT